MKFGFVTSVALGRSCIEEIFRIGGKLDVLVTLQDEVARKKSGRVYLDDIAAKHKTDLLKCKNINDDDIHRQLEPYGLDWLLIIGWSQIAKSRILSLPRRGVLGMHPTLLPEGRGRASIPWAILKGLKETGVTLFKLDEGVDTGPIIFQERIPLAPDETATALYEKVNESHRSLIANVWPLLVADTVRLMPQDASKATCWEGRSPADGRITPAMGCEEAGRLVRAVTKPYPGAFVEHEGVRYIVWSGELRRGVECPHAVAHENGALTIRLSDGIFISREFEQLIPPASATP